MCNVMGYAKIFIALLRPAQQNPHITSIIISLVHRGSSHLFNVAQEKQREPGKTYHTRDIAVATDLFNSSGIKSSQFPPLRHSHDKIYQAPSFFVCKANYDRCDLWILLCWSEQGYKDFYIPYNEPGYEATS